MKILSLFVFGFLLVLFITCSQEDGFKGKVVISITDSPLDADEVKGVNLVLTSVELNRKGEWKSVKTFDQPLGINLLAFADGKSFAVVDQLIEPGTFTEIRLKLNVSDGAALIRNPLCNIEFTDGTTQPILLPENSTTEIIITKEISIRASQTIDLTLDVDVRKSVIKNEQGHYIFNPSIRTLETFETGSIMGKVLNLPASDRMVVFAYKAGLFNSSESNLTESIRFKNSITASKVKKGKFTTAFLEAGTYDLAFIRQSKSGEFLTVVGVEKNITIQARDQKQLEVDINKLTGS